jgi:hypothetical protein
MIIHAMLAARTKKPVDQGVFPLDGTMPFMDSLGEAGSAGEGTIPESY